MHPPDSIALNYGHVLLKCAQTIHIYDVTEQKNMVYKTTDVALCMSGTKLEYERYTIAITVRRLLITFAACVWRYRVPRHTRVH